MRRSGADIILNLTKLPGLLAVVILALQEELWSSIVGPVAVQNLGDHDVNAVPLRCPYRGSSMTVPWSSPRSRHVDSSANLGSAFTYCGVVLNEASATVVVFLAMWYEVWASLEM